MDVGELQDKHESQKQASWIPATPAKPNLPLQKLIYEPPPPAQGNNGFQTSCSSANWGEFNNVSFRELLLKAEAGAMHFLIPALKENDEAPEGPVICAEKGQIAGNLGDSSPATRHPENHGAGLETSSCCKGKCDRFISLCFYWRLVLEL